MSLDHIRNFCIIAHVDHGKTTLSDRLLEHTKTIEKRQMKEQLLDAMDLEREKGITIKCHPVTMNFTAPDGKQYILNLIDTPGHVDFAYEVSRSLAACEGAVLLIDASQGVEAQTVANATLAMNQGLEIVPVINKVDLPSARPEEARRQVEDILTIPAQDAVLASGKSGIGIDDIFAAIIKRVPAPRWSRLLVGQRGPLSWLKRRFCSCEFAQLCVGQIAYACALAATGSFPVLFLLQQHFATFLIVSLMKFMLNFSERRNFQMQVIVASMFGNLNGTGV